MLCRKFQPSVASCGRFRPPRVGAVACLGIVADTLPIRRQLFGRQSLLGCGRLVPRRPDGDLAHNIGCNTNTAFSIVPRVRHPHSTTEEESTNEHEEVEEKKADVGYDGGERHGEEGVKPERHEREDENRQHARIDRQLRTNVPELVLGHLLRPKPAKYQIHRSKR